MMSDIMTMTNSAAPNAGGLNNCTANGNGSDGAHIGNASLDNLEEILMELTDFERELSKASSMLGVTIPPQLETYLKAVADVGTPQFPWNKIKSLFKVKLEQVIFEFNSSSPISEIPAAPNVDPFDFNATKTKVLQQLDAFIGIPFTVQRLAELITSPRKHYRRTDKFMRALEKNMLVVSTVEAREPSTNILEPASEPTLSATGHSIFNGNDHNVLPMSHMRRAQSPTSTGFVKSSRLNDSPSKDSEMKEVELVKSRSDDEDKENVSDELQSREMGTKKSDSPGSLVPSDTNEAQPSVAKKTSDPAMDVDNKDTLTKDEPSTSNEDTSKHCDDNSKMVLNESDLASSSSDVTEEADDDCTKTADDHKTSDGSVATSSVSDCQQHKPDEGEPNADDGGPCDSAEDKQNVTLADSSKTDIQMESQVGTSEPLPSTDSTSVTETKDNFSAESTNAQTSVEQPLPATPSEEKETGISSGTSEVEKMEIDAECTSSDTPIHTSP